MLAAVFGWLLGSNVRASREAAYNASLPESVRDKQYAKAERARAQVAARKAGQHAVTIAWLSMPLLWVSAVILIGAAGITGDGLWLGVWCAVALVLAFVAAAQVGADR